MNLPTLDSNNLNWNYVVEACVNYHKFSSCQQLLLLTCCSCRKVLVNNILYGLKTRNLTVFIDIYGKNEIMI